MRFSLICMLLWLAGPVAAAEIVSARYADATARYPHGVLGDDVEYAALEVVLSDGSRQRAVWGDEMVFEDIAPRVVDVTGDGAPEVVVVESHQSLGARLAVWGLRDGRLVALARTPHIGTRFRWLAVAAVADLDGDGAVEIAYVDRPHLAKVLRVWRYRNGALREVTQSEGLTNHRIGWDFIAGGLRACGGAPEIVLADAGWARIIATRLQAGRLVSRDIGAYDGPASLDRATRC